MKLFVPFVSFCKKVFCLLVFVTSLSGCATKNTVELAKLAKAAYDTYQAQPRTYCAVLMTGSNITITGVDRLMMEAPLTPLQLMPDNPDTVGRIADATKNTILGAAGIAGLTYSSTRPPTIVEQPAPTIVRPEVVHPVIVP